MTQDNKNTLIFNSLVEMAEYFDLNPGDVCATCGKCHNWNLSGEDKVIATLIEECEQAYCKEYSTNRGQSDRKHGVI